MHTVKLRLMTTEYDEYVIGRRFNALAHVHNVTVKYAKKLLLALKYNKDYQLALQEYAKLLKKGKDNFSADDKLCHKELQGILNDIRKSVGLTESNLQAYAKICGARFKKLLSSQQVQKEATRVWRGVDAVLFGDGHDIHFKKAAELHTIGGKSNLNGARFDMETTTVNWMGLNLACKLPKKPSNGNASSARARDYTYTMEALNGKISYCEIERQMFSGGWHYYVILYIDGDAPDTGHSINLCAVGGLDPGVSSEAFVSDDAVMLEELAPKAGDYERRINKLQKSMDRSLRALNPDNYNPDGTIKKDTKTFKKKWKRSNHYKKMQRQVKTLYRKQTAYTKACHGNLANRILAEAGNIITEDMNFPALAKKSKRTEKQQQSSTVKNKKGEVRSVRKYKRKKRFGHSVRSRSPALFLAILKDKCIRGGGIYACVDMRVFKASQYRHDTGECEKVPLSQREKLISGFIVQRDLYSAFLLCNADASLSAPDREKCIYTFGKFLEMQYALIASMKAENISMKQCFGFDM